MTFFPTFTSPSPLSQVQWSQVGVGAGMSLGRILCYPVEKAMQAPFFYLSHVQWSALHTRRAHGVCSPGFHNIDCPSQTSELSGPASGQTIQLSPSALQWGPIALNSEAGVKCPIFSQVQALSFHQGLATTELLFWYPSHSPQTHNHLPCCFSSLPMASHREKVILNWDSCFPDMTWSLCSMPGTKQNPCYSGQQQWNTSWLYDL